MTDPFRIGDYRDGTAGRVPCPKCGTLIIEDATQCYACGIHFQRGTAYDFSPRARARRRRTWVRWLSAIVVISLLVITVLAAMRFVWS
jgi:uncharacterized membrane protein YvbJ